MDVDIAVVGAGTVGAAIGYGLARKGVRVLVLDGNDRDFRAAAANFGLVWQSGKGIDMPAYLHLTRDAVADWRDFETELNEITGIDLHYENNGGLTICVGEAEFEQRLAAQRRLHNQQGHQDPDWEMLDRSALSRLLPRVQFGADVTGAGFGRRDGHVNPLRLLAALHSAIVRLGGSLRGGVNVTSVEAVRDGLFCLSVGDEKIHAARVVIAAGLGTKVLASQLGIDVAIRAQRGQILVTERLEPFLALPMSGFRQTREGTVMVGLTHEEVGLDSSTTVKAAATLSSNAIKRIPAISQARLVRQWAGLRIMTPDGHPIYAESERHPGAFVALCHSGITLASAHSGLLASAIAAKDSSPP